jgi:hypothetical protein
MIGNDLSKTGFQIFFLSKEESKCPIIPKIVTFLNRFMENHPISDLSQPIISLTYGKRIIINCASPSVNKLDKRNFLEIVDYDPIKHTYLLIGLSEPPIETPLHWMILNAKKEINVILQIKIDLKNNLLSKNFALVDSEYLPWSLENTREVLKSLRNKNCVVLGDSSILCAAFNLEELKNIICKVFEG